MNEGRENLLRLILCFGPFPEQDAGKKSRNCS